MGFVWEEYGNLWEEYGSLWEEYGISVLLVNLHPTRFNIIHRLTLGHGKSSRQWDGSLKFDPRLKYSTTSESLAFSNRSLESGFISRRVWTPGGSGSGDIWYVARLTKSSLNRTIASAKGLGYCLSCWKLWSWMVCWFVCEITTQKQDCFSFFCFGITIQKCGPKTGSFFHEMILPNRSG